jgi:hypothetical protein
MTLFKIAQAIEGSPIGQAIRQSDWAFPVIEIIHLIALATLGGSVLMIALCVFGVGVKMEPKEVAVGARPLMLGAVITLLVSGVLLGVSESVKLLDREAFTVKMAALALALLFTFLVFNPMVRRGATGAGVRGAAALTLALWLTVAMAGRWIGFS